MTSRTATAEDVAKFVADNVAEERRQNAERLAEYQRECLASWKEREK